MNPDMSDEELMNLAKGVTQIKRTPVEAEIENWKTKPTSSRDLFTKRRQLRKALFAVVKNQVKGSGNLDDRLQALKEIIEPQLNSNLGMKWEGYTFVWDIHPTEITRIIRKEEWVREGGGFDPEFGNHSPNAFTQQEI